MKFPRAADSPAMPAPMMTMCNGGESVDVIALDNKIDRGRKQQENSDDKDRVPEDWK
jgi:hypothetical protein